MVPCQGVQSRLLISCSCGLPGGESLFRGSWTNSPRRGRVLRHPTIAEVAPLPARHERGEGRGEWLVPSNCRALLKSPLPDPLPTSPSWGEGIDRGLGSGIKTRPRGGVRPDAHFHPAVFLPSSHRILHCTMREDHALSNSEGTLVGPACGALILLRYVSPFALRQRIAHGRGVRGGNSYRCRR